MEGDDRKVTRYHNAGKDSEGKYNVLKGSRSVKGCIIIHWSRQKT